MRYINLFKDIKRKVIQYQINRLEIMASILKDEVESLVLNSSNHPNSERLTTLYEIKRDELDTVTFNIAELTKELESTR